MAVMIKGAEVVRLARQALAERWAYVWGANGDVVVTPALAKAKGMTAAWLAIWINRIAADCSGLITFISRAVNAGLSDTTAAGWYGRCRKLASAAMMQPGDLVFRRKLEITGWRVCHVGVYVGDDSVVEEASPELGAIHSRFSTGKWWAFGRLPFVMDDPTVSNSVPVSLKVLGGSVNVRLGPGVTNAWLTTVHANDVFACTGLTENGWFQITLKGQLAWISGRSDLVLVSYGPAPESPQQPMTKTVTATSYYVRSGPSTAEKPLGTVHNGDVLKILSVSGTWGEILFNGKSGWISLNPKYVM